jgi:general secretion pathway protein L
MAALLPEKIKTYFRGDHPLVVQLLPEGVCFQGSDGLRCLTPLEQVALQLPSDLQNHLKQADSVVLLLPAKQVLRRVIELPLAALSDLGSAIPFQLARQTPFPVDRTSYAYRLTGRDKINGIFRVELAMTAKPALDQLQSKLAASGVYLSATRIEADDSVPPLEFNTRREAHRGSWFKEPWKPILTAGAVIAFLGPCLIAWHLHVAADKAVTSVAESAKAASAAEGLQHQLQEAIASAAFVSGRFSGPRIIEVLKATTAALPDDSWVFNFDIKGSSLRLNGYSANVRSIVERLQAVPFFEAIEFPSPVVHDLARKQDRFDILIHVRTNSPRSYAAH